MAGVTMMPAIIISVIDREENRMITVILLCCTIVPFVINS